jgi:hypothetical protein
MLSVSYAESHLSSVLQFLLLYNVSNFNCYAECSCSDCQNAECQNVECQNAECQNAERHYPECCIFVWVSFILCCICFIVMPSLIILSIALLCCLPIYIIFRGSLCRVMLNVVRLWNIHSKAMFLFMRSLWMKCQVWHINSDALAPTTFIRTALGRMKHKTFDFLLCCILLCQMSFCLGNCNIQSGTNYWVYSKLNQYV